MGDGLVQLLVAVVGAILGALLLLVLQGVSEMKKSIEGMNAKLDASSRDHAEKLDKRVSELYGELSQKVDQKDCDKQIVRCVDSCREVQHKIDDKIKSVDEKWGCHGHDGSRIVFVKGAS